MRVSGWDLAFWIIILAIVTSLVRPGSKAGTVVVSIMSALAAVIGETTGYEQRKGSG